jgi:hypothetical protein
MRTRHPDFHTRPISQQGQEEKKEGATPQNKQDDSLFFLTAHFATNGHQEVWNSIP